MYRLPSSAMINMSHGHRRSQQESPSKPTAVVKPQYGASGSSPRQPPQKHLNQSNSARYSDDSGSNAWSHNKPFEARYRQGDTRSRKPKMQDDGQPGSDAHPKVLMSRSNVATNVASSNRQHIPPQSLMSIPPPMHMPQRMMYPPPPPPHMLPRHPMQMYPHNPNSRPFLLATQNRHGLRPQVGSNRHPNVQPPANRHSDQARIN